MSSRRIVIGLVVSALLLLGTAESRALTVLTVGKRAVFGAADARVRVGHDRRLSPLADPTCGGDETRIQIASYPVATQRLVAQDEVTLPCAHWRRTGKGFVYEDRTGSAGGVTMVAYSTKRLVVTLGGSSYRPLPGPVGYAELWFQAGSTRFLTRFHVFTQNGPSKIVTLELSKLAARGETIFWDVIHGDDKSERHMQEGLAVLGQAAEKKSKDGRSPFLLGMLHLYRYGLFLDGRGRPTDAARAEIDATNEAFARAAPLLWNGTTGDSRVPGFVAAAK